MPLIGAYVFGVLTATQSRVNGELSSYLGNGIEAAAYSFSLGLVLSLAFLLLPKTREAVRGLPAALRRGELAWWQLLGGIVGGLFVGAQAVTVPMLGVAVFTVAVVAGQSANSIIVDRIGLGPAGRQPVTLRRVLSAALAFTAVMIAVSDRFGAASFSLLAVATCFLVGAGTSVQQAFNGRITRATGQPTPGTMLNFLTGTVVLLAIFAGTWVTGHHPSALGGAPWWAYLGGLVGVIFIVIAAWVVPIIGVLVFAVLSIAGQLSCALLLDVVAPTSGTSLGWHLVAGVGLAFVAVGLAAARRAA
ncbi:MAG: DMT family transporter [Actinomycetales bacterium]|nr:DMT family transporter [Actinomycetales bacterium]